MLCFPFCAAQTGGVEPPPGRTDGRTFAADGEILERGGEKKRKTSTAVEFKRVFSAPRPARAEPFMHLLPAASTPGRLPWEFVSSRALFKNN